MAFVLPILFTMKSSSQSYLSPARRFLLLILLPAWVVTPPTLHADQTTQVSAGCSINVYKAGDSDLTDDELFPDAYKNSVVSPGQNQMQLLRMAFEGLPEFACKAVNRVAFVKKKNGQARAWVASQYPDLLMVGAPDAQGGEEGDYFATENRLMLRGESLQMVNPDNNEQMPVSAVLKLKLEVWSQVIKTIMHEAMHSATNILENKKAEAEDNHCSSYEKNFVVAAYDGSWGFKNRDADYYPDVWGADANSDAEKSIEKTGLQEGLYNEWCRMQKAFVDAKRSVSYDLEIQANNPTDIPEDGFFSKYGQEDPAEDIAEIASLIQFNHYQSQGHLTVGNLTHLDISEGEWQRYSDVDFSHNYYNVCKAKIQTTQKVGVPMDLMATYTKMNLLLDLGFITEDAYKACIGAGKLGLQNGGKETTGFHRLDYETGEWIYRHDIDKLGHTIVHPDRDEKLFIIIGKGTLKDNDGKQYNMQMQLRFNRTNASNLPRGIYLLNWLWSPTDPQPCPPLFSSSDSSWTFFVDVENAPSKSFCTVAGQILVTRSSKNFIEAGMVIQKILKRVGGPPVQLPSAPVLGGVPLASLATGTVVPEVPNFRVYIRWER